MTTRPSAKPRARRSPRGRHVAWALAAGALGAGCSRRNAGGAPPTPRPAPAAVAPLAPATSANAAPPGATPVTPAAPTTAVAPPTRTDTVANNAAPAGPPCTATPTQSFHLRPTNQVASTGAELPAGTALDVLDVAPDANDAGAPRRRHEQTMLRVRVRTTGAEGYTFASAREVSGACRVLWPASMIAADPRAQPPAASHGATRQEAISAGYRAVVGADGPDLTEETTHTVARADLDGDGTDDELVRVDTGNEAMGLVQLALLRAANGFDAFEVGVAHSNEHASWAGNGEPLEPVRAGGAVYLPFLSNEVSTEPDPPVNDKQQYSLTRCRRGGPCVVVFAAFTTFGSAETWTFEDAGNGAVRVRSSLGPSQTLRWDAAAFRLVP